jgi:chloride channel 7
MRRLLTHKHHLGVELCARYDDYNELQSLFLSPSSETVQQLFTLGAYNLFSAPALLIFFVVYFLLAVISAGMSVTSGLVIPMLILGGSFGRLCAVIVNMGFKVFI